jgi:O-antigen ligase
MTIAEGTATGAQNDSIASSGRPTEQRERTPWLLGFLCLLIPALPGYVVPAGPVKSYGSPAKVIAALLFGLAILGFFLLRRTAKSRAFRPGVVLILLFFILQLAIYGVGLTHLDDAAIESNKGRVLFLMISYTGVALYIMTRVQTTRQRSILLGCLTIGLTFACIVGLVQQADIDLRFLFKPPGFVINLDDYSTFFVRRGVKRAWGTAVHPLEFSVLAAVTILLSLHFARHAADRQVRWIAALAGIVAFFALPVAVSRSGLVALLAGLFVYMWNFKARSVCIGLVGAATAVVAYVAMLPNNAAAVWETIVNSEEDPSVATRVEDYATVAATFRDHPIFGLGLGAGLPSEYTYLDNEWLQAIVQGGIIGVAAMIVLAAGGIFGICAALRCASTARERDQAYATGAIFVAVLSSSFTMDLFSCQQASLILFISFGLLWSTFKVPFDLNKG